MSQFTVWSFPTRILFGVGVVGQTGAEARRLGASRALIVTDKGVVRSGLLEPVAASLRNEGVEVAVFDDVLGNPIEKNVHDGVAAFREARADLVVALGGGSPLDVGKLVRLGVNHTRPLVDYDDATGGDRFITPDVPPMLAIPTTAGTGSEVGRSGVVTLDVNHRKTVIFSPYLLANAALLDPELTRSMPAFLTAATGFDALTHCVEAYVAKGDHPMADGIALEGIRLAAAHLERAVSHGNDLDARGGMMKAAMMGAVAFQKGLGACHSLAHPLSSECGLHHGLANALCLPPVVEFNVAAAGPRLARVAALLGGPEDAAACADAIRALRTRIGLAAGLEKAGVRRDKLDALADLAAQDACHSCNPRPCSREDLRKLYEASFAG
ncbi:alcohol dehydrogenase [Sorangium cellulosum]|uniref:Alcohol dehydrogenase n=2 Tax=Polyangiaceae TaxID=49 RepID=A0A150QCX7_SORCE|nr:iron-containing alcohol dehydrogenase [Sorangium cellulosum]KYF65809.1 alcohol dehydrogenase [Sorangium cellulosum]